MSSFSDLPLLPTLVTSLAEQGIRKPTPIQAQTIDPLLAGTSLVGISQTGSGKTLAFVLPMLHQLKTLEFEGSPVHESGRPRGLVLVPGRELGEQVSRVFKSLTHGTRLRVRTALGGTKKQVARQSVAGMFEILVATPGRLNQLMDSGELRVDDVRTLVFDEADQMLDGGFLPTARRVVKAAPKALQLVLFAATMPQTLESVVRSLFGSKPLKIQTENSELVVETLVTDNRMVSNGRRLDMLATVLAEDATVGTAIFVNTREQCDTVADWLKRQGLDFSLYRGQMDRTERRASLARFREGKVSILLATDLGGRGLDIERIDRVINVHLPQQIENYLHRVGRTARAGRDGTVVNLVTQRDGPLMAKLAKREQKRTGGRG